MCNFQRLICNMQFAMCNLIHAMCNVQHVMCNVYDAMCKRQCVRYNVEDAIWECWYANLLTACPLILAIFYLWHPPLISRVLGWQLMLPVGLESFLGLQKPLSERLKNVLTVLWILIEPCLLNWNVVFKYFKSYICIEFAKIFISLKVCKMKVR